MLTKVINPEVSESLNKDISYPVIWGGNIVDLKLKSDHIKLETENGIRTPFCRSTLLFKDGDWYVTPGG